MKYRKVTLLIAFVLAAMSVSARENAMGLRFAYNTRNASPAAGLWYQHEFAPHFRLSPNVEYIFKHEGTDALSINCNAQFPFRFGNCGQFAFYPLAGLNYTSWNHHHDDTPLDSNNTRESDGDVTSRTNRFGLNAGAGLEYRVSPTLKLSLEAKGAFVKSYSSATISLSIGYCF